MKHYLYLCCLLFCSCSAIDDAIKSEDNDVYITINTIPQVENLVIDNKSRAVTENTSGAACEFFYQNGDGLGLFPDNGYQIPFFAENVPNNKANSVSIIAKGWKTDPALNYASYFPYDRNNFDGHAIPFSYAGSKQVGNNNAMHIKDKMLRVSNITTANGQNFSFDIRHVGTTFKFTLTVTADSYPVSFTRFAFVGPDATTFVKSGTYNMFSNPQQFNPESIVYSRLSSLDLENVSISNSTENVVVFMAFAPFIVKAGTYTVILWDNNGNTYTGTRSFGSDINIPGNSSNSLPFTMTKNNAIKTTIEQYITEEAAAGGINVGN